MRAISVAELEQLLLSKMRSYEGCGTVEQITVISRKGGDWIIGPIRRGRTDLSLIFQATRMLETRFRELYTLVEEGR